MPLLFGGIMFFLYISNLAHGGDFPRLNSEETPKSVVERSSVLDLADGSDHVSEDKIFDEQVGPVLTH